LRQIAIQRYHTGEEMAIGLNLAGARDAVPMALPLSGFPVLAL
jgi:hypothetical protein